MPMPSLLPIILLDGLGPIFRKAAFALLLTVPAPAISNDETQSENEVASAMPSQPESADQSGVYPKKLANADAAETGHSLVVGSIHYLKKDGPSECGGFLGECDLFILPPTGRKPITYSFKRSGEFAWSLPPGDYTMLALRREDDIQGVRLAFSVPADGSALYLGDIVFMIFNGLLVTGLVDAYEKAQTEFEAKFDGTGEPLIKSLAGDEESLGAWSEKTDICEPEWGLACKPKRQGLTPILPNKGKGMPRFRVMDLRPQFSWEPSMQEGVTYDLAIYESARFGGLFKKHMRGRLIRYIENLVEPQWRPEEPFEPGRQYYWSIRLRKGQTVSNWSTYSYALMAGLGTATVYRAWLRFDTPTER